MGELVITTHGFEESKNQLKAFSEQTPKNLELDKVDTKGGLFGFFDHTVKGHELNNLTSQIQSCLIDFNSLNTKFIKEFGQVYNALEALDKDYIQAILIAIKAAEKANTEVKLAQNDITKTIEFQKKIIFALKQFKEKVESYKHLDDIDKIWKKCSDFEDNITSTKYIVSKHEEEIGLLKNYLQQIQKQNDEKNKIFYKKLKIAYVLASSSIGFAIIEFILFKLRII